MTLIKSIKDEFKQARISKDKIKTDILKVLLGEIESDQKRGTNVDDAMIIAKIKKLIQSNKECLESTFAEDTAAKLSGENKVLEVFLPKQLTKAEISALMRENGPFKNIGACMGFLKKNYAGLYDGKTASEAAKELL